MMRTAEMTVAIAMMAEEELVALRVTVEEALDSVRYMTDRPRGQDEATMEARAFERIPEHLRDGVRLYLTEHQPCGHYLTAVLSNDLREALGRADTKSRVGLHDLLAYLYNHAPGPAWGDPAAVKRWLRPTISAREYSGLGDEVAMIHDNNRVYLPCPVFGCEAGKHPGHTFQAEPGIVTLPTDGRLKASHDVLYVWHTPFQLEVVAIDGRAPLR